MDQTGGPAIERIRSAAAPAFADLLAIYEDVIDERERKSGAELAAMSARQDCIVLAARLGDEVAGFAIVVAFESAPAAALDYLGTSRGHQGQGIGKALFLWVTTAAVLDGRPLILEVDAEADAASPEERALRQRRKHFYRRLGCREIAGLAYRMPQLAAAAPPAMNLMVFDPAGRTRIGREEAAAWIRALYVELYGRAENDPAIHEMVEGLGPELALV